MEGCQVWHKQRSSNTAPEEQMYEQNTKKQNIYNWIKRLNAYLKGFISVYILWSGL